MNFVLHEQSSLPDIPLIVEFRKAHRELLDHIQKAKERFQQLAAASAAHAPLEMALDQKKKELAAAEADLVKMAQSLGNAAFHAFLAGKVGEIPVFAERLDLHRKIADLGSEMQSLAAPENAGMIQKTTAKGQQLIVAGKIKFAAMKEGSLETAIGRNLLHTNQEASVCCDQTSSVLDAIRKQRSCITALVLRLIKRNMPLTSSERSYANRSDLRRSRARVRWMPNFISAKTRFSRKRENGSNSKRDCLRGFWPSRTFRGKGAWRRCWAITGRQYHHDPLAATVATRDHNRHRP